MEVNELNLKIDLRMAVAGLLIVIAVMLGIWRPWDSSQPTRTITVTGEGSISAAPDEFSFAPYYQASGTDSNEALNKVTKTGNEVVAKVKEFGVKDEQITTQITSGGYDYLEGAPRDADSVSIRNQSYNTATFSLTITVDNKDLAQRILDHLLTTSSVSGVFPTSTFRDDTRTDLELDARKKGSENARRKAKETVKELGARLGRVVKISELNQFRGPIILDSASEGASAKRGVTSPRLETGSQDLSFTITVEYEIK